MKHAFIGRTLLPFVLAIGSSVTPITAHAQQADFADNFAVDSTRYSTDSFTDASGLYTVDYRDNALRLSSTGTGTEPGNINLNMAAGTDKFMADVTLSSEGTVLQQSSASNSAVYIEGYFYNDTYDTEAQTGREGDIWISLGFRVNESGDRVADYCFSRIDTNGDRQNIGESGSELCNDLPDAATLPLDTQHKAGIEIDRAAKSVTVSIGGLSRQIALTGNVYKPYRNQQRMQARQFGAPATTVVLVHRIETDTFSDNFSVTRPPINRYRNNYFPASRNLSATDGQATLFATTDDPDDGESAELWLQQYGDYLEAVVTLSSESSFTSGESDVGAIVKLAAYNDVQDGGANGEEGDVEARIQFRTQGNGRRAARYCLVRANDPDYDSVTGLLEDGVECLNIPLLVEFDRAYRVALELDRAAKTMSFALDDQRYTVNIQSDIYQAAGPRRYVGVSANRQATGVVHVDDLRTSPDSLTPTEVTNGLTSPAPFPDPVDAAALLQVDSSIEQPFDFSNQQPTLDFVDDFSGITTAFGFWGGRDRGESAISWNDGAVTLKTNTAEGIDNGNYTELYLQKKSDLIEAVVSLSSATRLPPSGDTGAEIIILASLYNDTQDYGFNDQEGDLQAELGIQFEGDGSRRMRVRLRRTDASGNRDLNLLEGLMEFDDGIGSIIPQLDTQYKLSIGIDRSTGVIRFGVDDQFTDYQSLTGTFLPARQRSIISVSHFRGSGVAVGNIHSIKTDSIDVDFSQQAPLIAPYRPAFNAQYPGVAVEAVDGRLRLEADGALTSDRDPRIAALSASDYIGASIELSSDSVIQTDGTVLIDVHGIMYNDLPGGTIEQGNSEGRVFATVRLTAESNTERYVQYCAFRSNDSSFDDTTELVGGDPDNCPRFTTVPEFDTAYPAFIRLDRDAATLTFGFNGEEVIYNITTGISNAEPFSGVRASTSEGSKVIAWADDLSFAENPVALADSSSTLVSSRSDSNASTTTDGSSGGGSTAPGLLMLLLLRLLRTKRILPDLKRRVTDNSRYLLLALLCVPAIAVQSCATNPQPIPSSFTALEQAEVLNHIRGKTETWSQGGAFYNPDGSLQVVWDGLDTSGNWRVTEAGDVCFVVELWGPDEDCHSYRYEQNIVKLVYQNKSVQRATFNGEQLAQYRP